MEQDRLYFEQRERMERAAAESAANSNARRAHQELAKGYAALARGNRRVAPGSDDSGRPSHLTIIG